MDTYPQGMAFLVWGITGVVLLISVFQFECERKGWPSISYQVGGWSAANPWLSRAIVLVFFFLLAHFVLNPLHPQ